ncbi:MAG: hypothetical protein AB7G06_09275 [Bdellovibrionales bacterium]
MAIARPPKKPGLDGRFIPVEHIIDWYFSILPGGAWNGSTMERGYCKGVVERAGVTNLYDLLIPREKFVDRLVNHPENPIKDAADPQDSTMACLDAMIACIGARWGERDWDPPFPEKRAELSAQWTKEASYAALSFQAMRTTMNHTAQPHMKPIADLTGSAIKTGKTQTTSLDGNLWGNDVEVIVTVVPRPPCRRQKTAPRS